MISGFCPEVDCDINDVGLSGCVARRLVSF